MSRTLRVATEADTPVKQKSITEAADAGSRRELLVAMRTRVARAVQDPNCPARELASLTRRLMEIANDIEAIDAASGEGGIGEAVATPDQAFDATAL